MGQEIPEKVCMQLLFHGGTSRAKVYDALDAAIKGNFELAEKYLQESQEEALKAHKAQAKIIQEEAGGRGIKPTVLFIHALDILMIAMSEYDITKRLITILKSLAQ